MLNADYFDMKIETNLNRQQTISAIKEHDQK